MTFMHMDATSAAAAVGNIVGFTWEDTPPYTGIYLDDGGDGFWGESELSIYGEGTSFPGTYIGEEHSFEVLNEEWINPAFVGNIDQYFFHCLDITTWSDGSIPGIRTAYSGVWTLERTDWRCFASVTPHGNMVVDTIARFTCDARGAYGSSYSEEQIGCVLEIGQLVGITETFEFTNVDIGNDEIVLVGHGFETGDQVVYTQGGGSVPTPLVDQAMYSVRKVTNDRISLGLDLRDIDATPNFVNLTFSGTGTGHTFQRIDAVATVDLDMDSSV